MVHSEEPIERRKLSHQIEEKLLALVQSSGMAPGDLLPSERELMARYGVGRPAIREAMQTLERMGLVEIRHGERPRIAKPDLSRAVGQLGETMRHVLSHSQGSLEHLMQARLMFETQVVRLAAQQRTDQDIARMAATLEAQRRSQHDPSEFIHLDGQFHADIAVVTGNPIFVTLSEALFEWLSSFHAHLVRRPGLEEVTLAEHEAILTAIQKGDQDGAARVMADHLNRAGPLYSTSNRSRN